MLIQKECASYFYGYTLRTFVLVHFGIDDILQIKEHVHRTEVVRQISKLEKWSVWLRNNISISLELQRDSIQNRSEKENTGTE